MAKANKKKLVVTTKSEGPKLAPTTSKGTIKKAVEQTEMLFGKENFKWMFVGIGLIVLGFVLMAGGSMPDSNTWDESIIYSFRRITLAPILIISGLIVEVYAIFK